MDGYALIIGKGANLEAQGTIFTAACNNNLTPAASNMWQGILFEPGQSGESLHLSNGCIVANALYGVRVPDLVPAKYSGPTQYIIEDSRFEQNLYHIYDQGQRSNTAIAFLQGVTFEALPSLLPPHQANPDDTWPLEALHLTPTVAAGSSPGTVGASLKNITIMGCIYGIVANAPGQGPLAFYGNLNIGRALRVGLWLDEVAVIQQYPTHTVITMNTSTYFTRAYKAFGLGNNDQAYGILGYSSTATAPNANSATVNIIGYTAAKDDTTANRALTGIYLDKAYKGLTNLTLQNLTYGLSLRDGTADFVGNDFQNCWHGLRIRPNAGYTKGFTIACNSFSASNAATSSGFLVDDQAVLNQQGGPNQPQGNKFYNYQNGDHSLINRNFGSNFIYYRYQGSADELATIVSDGNGPFPNMTGSAIGTTSSIPLSSFCQTARSVTTGAQARGTSPTAYLQALMDTLRRQAAPAPRLDLYQATIRRGLLVEQPDTAALEAYALTLPIAHPAAFFGLGFDLLEQYRRAGQPRAVARLRPLLAARAAGQPAAEARLALFDAVGRVSRLPPGPARRVLPADSLTLRRVARTPGGAAEMAAVWFNYLYPGAGLRPAEAQPGPALRPTDKPSPVVVRALYPNPAADHLHVEATSVKEAQTVLLRLTDLLSGRVVLEKTLSADRKGSYQSDIDVLSLPPSQYAATLLVDGIPATTRKVLINR